MARKLGLIALFVVALIAAMATGALAWLVWFPDTLKPTLERLLTAQLGQQVRIEGPLRIKTGGITTIEVNGLHIGAPDWARANEIVAIERLRVAADVWAYLRYGTMNITEFTADSPDIALAGCAGTHQLAERRRYREVRRDPQDLGRQGGDQQRPVRVHRRAQQGRAGSDHGHRGRARRGGGVEAGR